jgi:hypothetical protein
MSDERIRGLVAAILNRREVVLNVGSRQGVTENMKFAILDQEGAEIRDPETGEVLGSVELPKVLVRAVRVQDSLAVARTYRKTRKNVGGVGLRNPLAGLFEPPDIVEDLELLEVSGKTYQEQRDLKASVVEVGDPVVEVVGSEFDVSTFE